MKNLLIILVSILILGCECTYNIDTPKEVIPTDFSDVSFINALPDYQNLIIYNNNIKVFDKLSYQSAIMENRKLIAGSSNLFFKSYEDSIAVFSTMINLEKDSIYSLIIYGKAKKNNLILIKEQKNQFLLDKCYIRFIYATNEAPNNIKIKLIENFNLEFELIKGSFTDYIQIEPLHYMIELYDKSKDTSLGNFNIMKFEKGKKYTILVKGFAGFNDKRKLQLVKYIKDINE